MTASPGELPYPRSVVVDAGPVDHGRHFRDVTRRVISERRQVEDGLFAVPRQLRVVDLDRGVRFAQEQLVKVAVVSGVGGQSEGKPRSDAVQT